MVRKTIPICFCVIYLLLVLNISCMKCVNDDDETRKTKQERQQLEQERQQLRQERQQLGQERQQLEQERQQLGQERQQLEQELQRLEQERQRKEQELQRLEQERKQKEEERLWNLHLSRVLYHTLKTNQEQDEQILKRQKEGDKIHKENRGEYKYIADENPSAKNARSTLKNELIIKIHWAPFDYPFKLSHHLHQHVATGSSAAAVATTAGLSRFKLSVGNGTKRFAFGNTDQADLLQLSVHDSWTSLLFQTPKPGDMHNPDGIILHIQFNTEEDNHMEFRKETEYSSGNKIIICPLPENMPKCELVELTAENRAALAQRQYRFRPSSELQQNKLTLQRIKCKGQANGLNAEFLRDRNAIDYAKSRLCTSNEYELTYWRKNHMRHITSTLKCDEAIHGLNRVNAFIISQKVSGQRPIKEEIEFVCKLEGGELLELESAKTKGLLDKMSDGEKAYLELLNHIETDTILKEKAKAKRNELRDKLVANFAKNNKGKGVLTPPRMGRMLAPQPYKMKKTSAGWKIQQMLKSASLAHANLDGNSSNNGPINSEGVVKLVNQRKKMRKNNVKKEQQIDNMYVLNGQLRENNEELEDSNGQLKEENGKLHEQYAKMARLNGALLGKLRQISDAFNADSGNGEGLKGSIDGILDGIPPYILARNSGDAQTQQHQQQQQRQTVAVAAAPGTSTSSATETEDVAVGATAAGIEGNKIPVAEQPQQQQKSHSTETTEEDPMEEN